MHNAIVFLVNLDLFIAATIFCLYLVVCSGTHMIKNKNHAYYCSF